LVSVTVKFKLHCHSQWKFSFTPLALSYIINRQKTFKNTDEATVCMRGAQLWLNHKFILCII